MQHLYVYFKAAEADASTVQADVTAMQARLAQEHGLAASLQRRPQAQNGLHTWMEVYAGFPADFEATLQQAVAEAAISTCIQGVRHAELFMDMPPCA